MLAERRKLGGAEAAPSWTGLARQLRAAPIYCCLVQDGLFERGNGMVVLARRTAAGALAMAAFLVDTYCLGVKDVMFRMAEVSDVDTLVATMGDEAPFVAVEPAYARKLLRAAVAYGRTLGFEPPADYAAAELLFGDILADACDASFRFGYEGKPFYVPGPSETSAQVRRRLEHLRRRLGDDGFDFAIGVEDLDGEV